MLWVGMTVSMVGDGIYYIAIAWQVYDLSNTPYVDVAGARMLRRLHDELAGRQIELRVVGAHSEVRDRLRFEKLQDWVGPINRHVSLREAVAMDTPLVALQSREEISK